MNKSGLLKPVTELAKGGSTIKNGILYLEPPIKFTLPGGTKVEQSELDLVKAFKFTAWSGASLSIGTALNTVLNTALPPHISCLFWCRSPDEIDKMKGE